MRGGGRRHRESGWFYKHLEMVSTQAVTSRPSSCDWEGILIQFAGEVANLTFLLERGFVHLDLRDTEVGVLILVF